MKPEFAKVLFRIFGTLTALLGLTVLSVNLALFFGLSGPDRLDNKSMVAMLVFNSCLSFYLMTAGYQVWFRWSPSAVRHGLWTLAILVFFGLLHLEKHIRVFKKLDLPLAYVVLSGVVAFFVYRFSTAYFCRILFPLDRRRTVSAKDDPWK